MRSEWREVAQAALFLAGNPAGPALPKRWWPLVAPEIAAVAGGEGLACAHGFGEGAAGGVFGLSGDGPGVMTGAQALGARLARRGLYEAAALCQHRERWCAALDLCERRGVASFFGAWGCWLPEAWREMAPVLHAHGAGGGLAPSSPFLGGGSLGDGWANSFEGAQAGMHNGLYVAIVGSRWPSPAGTAFARKAAEWAVSEGFGVLSGGAPGIDRAAQEAALAAGGALLEALPMGLEADSSWSLGDGQSGASALRGEGSRRWLQVSEAAPHEGFSTAMAMARNRLIYAGAVLAIVIEPRFKAGGSWHGAVAALRQRLCRVAVFGGTAAGPLLSPSGVRDGSRNCFGRSAHVGGAALGAAGTSPAPGADASVSERGFESTSLACAALAALGAVQVGTLEGLCSALAQPPPQPVLFAC